MAVVIKVTPHLPSEATVTGSLVISSIEKGQAGWKLTFFKTDNFGKPFGSAQHATITADGSSITDDDNSGAVINAVLDKNLGADMAAAMAAMQGVMNALNAANWFTNTP